MRQKINVLLGNTSGGDVVNIYNNTYELAGNVEMISFDATEDQTAFILPFSYTPGVNQLFVYSSGLIQFPASDYEETDSTTITFAIDRTSGEKIIISKIKIADTTEYTLVVNNDYTTLYINNDYTTMNIDYSTFVINDYTNIYQDFSSFFINDSTNIYQDFSTFVINESTNIYQDFSTFVINDSTNIYQDFSIFNDYTNINNNTYELAGNVAIVSFDVTSSQSIFELPMTYTPGLNQLQVYINGLLVAPSSYIEVDTTTIEFYTDKTSGDVIIVSRIQVADTTEYTINVTNDYTNIYNDYTNLIFNDYSTFNTDYTNLIFNDYSIFNIDYTTVVVNDITDVTNEYSNYITNDIVNQYVTENVFNDYSVAGQVLSYSADAIDGQKEFVLSFSYIPYRNQIEVHSGGMLMYCGSDYAEDSTTSIRFFEPRMLGEKVVVTKISLSDPLDATDGIVQNPIDVTGDYTANIFDRIFANSADFTFEITFPSNPVVNNEIEVICVTNSFETNPIEINPNGKKIFGGTSFVIDINKSFQFVYSGEAYGQVLR